jgi:hypothetical protein
VSIRRLFWLEAAVLFSIAALVAIAAVLSGSFGTTQEHVLETCSIAFVYGAIGSSRARLGSSEGIVLRERT